MICLPSLRLLFDLICRARIHTHIHVKCQQSNGPKSLALLNLYFNRYIFMAGNYYAWKFNGRKSKNEDGANVLLLSTSSSPQSSAQLRTSISSPNLFVGRLVCLLVHLKVVNQVIIVVQIRSLCRSYLCFHVFSKTFDNRITPENLHQQAAFSHPASQPASQLASQFIHAKHQQSTHLHSK